MARLVAGGARAGLVLVVVAAALASCVNAGLGEDQLGLDAGLEDDQPGTGWARTVVATFGSVFDAVAHDADGNAYAVGYQTALSTYVYGDGVAATAGAGSGERAVIVKYSPSGTPLWARTVSTAPAGSRFYGVAVAGDGSVYAVGNQAGTSAHTYESTAGPGVSVTGSSTSGNAVIVKYSSTGTVVWAQSVAGGTSRSSRFESVAVAGDGSVYAAGWQEGTDTYSYDGQTATGTATGTNANSVLVKYDSDGTAQWARTIYSGLDSEFRGVSVDGAGSVVAAGIIRGDGAFWFDATGAVAVTGPAFVNHMVVVKYNSGGDAQWARTVVSGSEFSEFLSVAADDAGNVYAAGIRSGGFPHDFGSGVVASDGSSGNVGTLVKYNSAGTAQWVRSPQSGNVTQYFAVAVDEDGNPHVAGVQNGDGPVSYGNGVSATAATIYVNAAAVKYSSAGAAQWARTTTVGAQNSIFNAISVVPGGAHYAVGYQAGSAPFEYGPGVTATSTTAGNNVVIVRFEP